MFADPLRTSWTFLSSIGSFSLGWNIKCMEQWIFQSIGLLYNDASARCKILLLWFLSDRTSFLLHSEWPHVSIPSIKGQKIYIEKDLLYFSLHLLYTDCLFCFTFPSCFSPKFFLQVPTHQPAVPCNKTSFSESHETSQLHLFKVLLMLSHRTM